jgi:hypothetical protein
MKVVIVEFNICACELQVTVQRSRLQFGGAAMDISLACMNPPLWKASSNSDYLHWVDYLFGGGFSKTWLAYGLQFGKDTAQHRVTISIDDTTIRQCQPLNFKLSSVPSSNNPGNMNRYVQEVCSQVVFRNSWELDMIEMYKVKKKYR